jgi:hypothetical protein
MRFAHTRLVGLGAVGALLAVTTSCDFADDLLAVDNPDAIQEEAANDPALLQVQLNGVILGFNAPYVEEIVRYSTFATDEMLTGLNWEGHQRVNQRIISYLEGPTGAVFERLSQGLRQGHNLAERIRGWAADDPDTDFTNDLARTLSYAGYSAVALGENMCQAVISEDPDNPSGTVLEQPDIFAAAIPYLTEAHDLAVADGDANLANFARTGLARAYLGQADWANAATWATQVTPGFEKWIVYSDVPDGRNPLQGSSHGGNFTHGIHPWFTGTHPSFDGTGFAFEDDAVIAPQTDPRIQHEPTDATGHNALTRLYKFFQGLRYADYTGETIAPADAACPACTGTDSDDMFLLAEFDTDFLLADYVEAQHHYHEALAMQGGNEATVLAFVNARRAVGNQPAVNLSGQDLIDELRRQRGKDLIMGGFRLGDLRRWTRYDPGNGPFDGGAYFPVGAHPVAQWGSYGDWTCFPIPLSEYVGNANLQSPTNPNVPPAI